MGCQNSMSNVDVSYPTPKRVHTLVFDRGTWFPFADPVQTGWIIRIKILSVRRDRTATYSSEGSK